MSGFLTHLASVALGQTVEGAARPSLPPRFATLGADRAGPGMEERPGDRWQAPAQAPAPARTAAEPSGDPPPYPDRDLAPAVSPPGEPASLPVSAALAVPPRRAPARPVSSPPEARHVRPSPPPIGDAAPPAVAIEVVPEPRAYSPAPAPPPVPVQAQEVEARPVRAVSAQSSRPAAPPPAAGATVSAPLSEEAVAGRTEAARPPAPVIHVTIDRIDVRAPAGPREVAPARRARAEPSVSLSDFLAGGSPRPRQ